MNKKFLLPATMALCGAWVWALVSGPVADDRSFGIPVLLVLCAVTLAAVRHVQVHRIETGPVVKVLSAGTLALIMFTVWGQLIGSFPIIRLPEGLPEAVRLSSLFLNGPLVAMITALLFAYPLAVLLPRFHWLVPAFAAVLVGLIQYEMLFDPAGRLFTRAVVTLELASLVVLVPIVVGFVGSRMQGGTSSPITAK